MAKYNGWSNYETWNVALWLDNDTSEYAQHIAQEIYDRTEANDTFTREEQAAIDLAQAIKDSVQEINPIAGQASMFADLLNAALDEVDWHEIAEHYLEDVEKEAV
jgi:hypothetical protein